jgi:DNA-3-methyladenine glycosylase
MYARLSREFFRQPTLLAARELLGTRLVRLQGGQRLAGIIVETEAYIGETDRACHARAGRTARTQVMFGPPGKAYVYFTYGMHWCLNFVTEADGFPAAVLIRSIHPTEGLETIRSRRGEQPPEAWCNGPAKLCQALGVDRSLNGADLCSSDSTLWVESGSPIPDSCVTSGPRVGLINTPEPWKSIPWRFWLTQPVENLGGNHVSINR